MQLTAYSVAEVVASLASIARAGERITGFDLSPLNRILEYSPEDMTVTVEAGITLAALQQKLSERGQWLPIDPPRPQTLTIGALLAQNKSGPRRYGLGTIRDYLLGIKVVLADGRVIKAGGKVVKNVAGYDLCKLFVGSRGTLGVIVEATFKVLPRPEQERFLKAASRSPEQLKDILDKVSASPLTPIVIDFHGGLDASTLVVGFAGTREDVDSQLQHAGEIGLRESASLDHEQQFWNSSGEPLSVSVLPTRIAATLSELAPQSYVARAGNGIIYYRGGHAPAKSALPHVLLRRIKEAYDPKNLLPDLPW